MAFKVIIYYVSDNGIASNLVEFKTYAELLECVSIIDDIEEGSITYLELQDAPATIKQPYLETSTTQGNENE